MRATTRIRKSATALCLLVVLFVVIGCLGACSDRGHTLVEGPNPTADPHQDNGALDGGSPEPSMLLSEGATSSVLSKEGMLTEDEVREYVCLVVEDAIERQRNSNPHWAAQSETPDSFTLSGPYPCYRYNVAAGDRLDVLEESLFLVFNHGTPIGAVVKSWENAAPGSLGADGRFCEIAPELAEEHAVTPDAQLVCVEMDGENGESRWGVASRDDGGFCFQWGNASDGAFDSEAIEATLEPLVEDLGTQSQATATPLPLLR